MTVLEREDAGLAADFAVFFPELSARFQAFTPQEQTA
jgi:hypothetical protein